MVLWLLLGALVLAPCYWLLVPERHRRVFLVLASVAGLALLDPRLPGLVMLVSISLYAGLRLILSGRLANPWRVVVPACLALVALFAGNKLGGSGGVLPSQGGLVWLGVSYLVLKAAAVLIDAARGSLRQAGFVDLLCWIVFLPTYTAGPIEVFDHFRDQRPRPSRRQILAGAERILFGLVKTMLLSHYLGVWLTPVLAEPASHAPGVLWLAAYASILRFYFDFSGYSDIAIGVSAFFGIEIQENFDNPLIRRNLVQLWQRWHMTLTAWLRRYLFVPISRGILGPGGVARDTLALVSAQLVTMTFCGLWHGLGWNFLVWGLLQAIGLLWVGRPARALGRYLPANVRAFWRESWLGYALSATITFHYFALTSVLVVLDIDRAGEYAVSLLAPLLGR
jgi:D-alanyl-lipoteichoic acid acyltransferase DltB (MBOAT superfamily)